MSSTIEPGRRRDRLPLAMFFCLTLAIGLALVLAAPARQPAADSRESDPADSGQAAAPAGSPGIDRPDQDSPEKLLKSIEQLREASPPADATGEQEDQFELERYRGIASAADRLLACELSPQQALEAVRSRLNALEMLARLGDERAAGEGRRFLEEVPRQRYGQLPDVERYLLDLRLMAAIRQPDQEQAADAARKLWPVVQRVLAAGQAAKTDYRLAMLMGTLFEQTDQPKLAAEAYRAFAAYFRKANVDWANQAAAQLEGTARLLTLVGQPLAIAGTLVDGQRFDLKSYRGRVVLVDFWATWCGPCVAELENLKRVYSQYHARGLEIVGVNLDDSREDLVHFLQERPIPWSILHDAPQGPAASGHPLAQHYGVTSLPTLILVDRQGRVLSTHARGQELHKLLAEQFGPAE
ncbi:MAG TPA: TlpA disulfide reductase family protein [Pirellulales bacterium]